MAKTHPIHVVLQHDPDGIRVLSAHLDRAHADAEARRHMERALSAATGDVEPDERPDLPVDADEARLLLRDWAVDKDWRVEETSGTATEGQECYILAHAHEHGTDLTLTPDREAAQAALFETVREWWDQEMSVARPKDPDAAIRMYFNVVNEKYDISLVAVRA